MHVTIPESEQTEFGGALEQPELELATWPIPPSRSFNDLSDCGLYAEVFQVASREAPISAAKLMSSDQGLRQRMRRLHLVQFPTKTNIAALLHALETFGWLSEDGANRGQYTLTTEGHRVAEESASDPTGFRRQLAAKLHERYIIPGWFVARLHALNPNGQGEVVLPAPPKSKGTERRLWNRTEWPNEYDNIVIGSAERANEVFPGSFPISMDRWMPEVRRRWLRLGGGRPPVARRRKRKARQKRETTFGTRERLVHAMREAAVYLMFGVREFGRRLPDFRTEKPPIPPRGFRVWCPRLDELEFIFYTDYHPAVPGRLLVPCGAFRRSAQSPPFEPLETIKDPYQRCLWLYQPRWEDIQGQFIRVLQETYRRFSTQSGSMYVSLLNVRDEVCRQLRLSSNLFDSLLQIAYQETLRSSMASRKTISISLESDITPEQQGAVGLNRRPVYIHNVPHSLIAIATTRSR